MRLNKVAKGHLAHRPLFGLMRLLSGHRAPDVQRTLMYRKAFFGGPSGALTQQVMRGESPWSVGERELFAAFVSKTNQCPF